jgi:hypothetical protein
VHLILSLSKDDPVWVVLDIAAQSQYTMGYQVEDQIPMIKLSKAEASSVQSLLSDREDVLNALAKVGKKGFTVSISVCDDSDCKTAAMANVDAKRALLAVRKRIDERLAVLGIVARDT